jgi:hypothetical protein
MMVPPIAVIGWGGSLAIVGGLVGIAFWILLIALIVLLAQRIGATAPASGRSAVRLLEERYARPPAPRATTPDSGAAPARL